MLSFAIVIIAFPIQDLVLAEWCVGIDLMTVCPGLKTTRDFTEIVWMIPKIFEMSEWGTVGREVSFRFSLLFH